jgi:hypothetical protein
VERVSTVALETVMRHHFGSGEREGSRMSADVTAMAITGKDEED